MNINIFDSNSLEAILFNRHILSSIKMKKKLLILFCLLFSLVAKAQTLEDDRQALLAMFDSVHIFGYKFNVLDTARWHYYNGWHETGVPWGIPGNEPCLWLGVSCFNNRVSGLNFIVPEYGRPNVPERNQYVGNLVSPLFKLTALQTLHIGRTSLTGTLSREIGNLRELRTLYIWNTALEGTIPAEIGNLSKLDTLELSNNSLTGSIPNEIENLKNLKFLSFAFAKLSGSVPAGIGQLSNLSNLNLNGNNLSGRFPSLAGLPAGARVFVRNNAFTFDGLEENASRLVQYAPQANIIIQERNGVLSVSVGGTLTNNTYRWYKDNVLVATTVADSTFTPSGPGIYTVQVNNRLLPSLTLQSNPLSTGALPVRLIAFSGKSTLQGNILSWITTQESENNGFSIERSTDGKSFESIGFIEGKGNTNTDYTYNFLDQIAIPLTYYRLKQIDWDGSYNYSKIISVESELAIQVYPNPSQGKLKVESSLANQSLRLLTHQGKILFEKPMLPSQVIDTSGYPKGLYILMIGSKSFRIILE